METIAQEAKRLLEPIPDEKWITQFYYSSSKPGCHCFIGHYNVIHGLHPSADIELCAYKIVGRISTFLKGIGDAFDINDGNLTKYRQDTPKQRVIALLDDMIAAGY